MSDSFREHIKKKQRTGTTRMDRKRRCGVVIPLLENNTKETGKRVNLGDSRMMPAAGPGLWTNQSHDFLQ